MALREQKSAYYRMRKSGRVIVARQAGWHRRSFIILSQQNCWDRIFIFRRGFSCSDFSNDGASRAESDK